MHSQRDPPLLHVVVCGGVGGAFADAIMHSMDTVKTRMQGQLTARNQKYSGLTQAIRTIVGEEGIRGLYGGFLSATVGSLLGTTIYFGSYEYLKRDLINRGYHPTLSFFVAAGIGDVLASIFYVPSEVLKTRLQLQGHFNNPHSLSAHNYQHTWHAISTIVRKRGLHGLYYGWWATLLRDVPFAGIQFTVYETLKRFFAKQYCDGDARQLTMVHDVVSGCAAGVTAGAITTPLDVIKTYLQTQRRQPRTSFLDSEALPKPAAESATASATKTPHVERQAASQISKKTEALSVGKMVGEEGPHVKAAPPPKATPPKETHKAMPLNAAKPGLASSSASEIPQTCTTAIPPKRMAGATLPPKPVVHAPFYPDVFSAGIGIYKRQGIAGLFSGVRVRMIWTGMQSTIMFMAYEYLLEMAR